MKIVIYLGLMMKKLFKRKKRAKKDKLKLDILNLPSRVSRNFEVK